MTPAALPRNTPPVRSGPGRRPAGRTAHPSLDDPHEITAAGAAGRRGVRAAAGRGGRPAPAFLALSGLVILASVAVRIALLGRQSYWIDELFTVRETSGSLDQLRRLASTEVHPPLYALLLWTWTRLGDSHEVWTRLLSTLCAVVSVVVAHRGLHGVRLDRHVHWGLTVATAAGGTSIVYSVDTRSYAPLLLSSVGLTAATLRAATRVLDREAVPFPTRLAWCGWSLAAATLHLFGAILTLGALAVLAVTTAARAPGRRAAGVASWVALAVLGCSLQGAWLLHGRGVPGFAAGTAWIPAPTRQDVWDLLTTTINAGGLRMHRDGFAWTSPAGVIALALLCLVALAGRLAGRSTGRGRARATAPAVTTEAPAAAVLLALAAVVVLGAFSVSQWRHLWTLRNMIVVAPALTWGLLCLAATAARTAAGRRWVATAAVTLLGASLVPVTLGIGQPYKTDFRGLFDELVAVRRTRPDATFVFLRVDPTRWQAASDLRPDDPAWRTLYQHVQVYPTTTPGALRTPGTEVVTFYRGVVDPRLDQEVDGLIALLGHGSCRRIPLQGLGVVRCG
ncbi:MAG TPA: hypothetical protein VI248_22970 [Kineosporiaceae bacterium]